jgi:hypothetical protein
MEKIKQENEINFKLEGVTFKIIVYKDNSILPLVEEHKKYRLMTDKEIKTTAKMILNINILLNCTNTLNPHHVQK